MVINGKSGNFTGATAVRFGTEAATSFTVNSDGTITAITPAGTAGPVDVTVTTPIGITPTMHQVTSSPIPYLRRHRSRAPYSPMSPVRSGGMEILKT